jgi:hypothetical protein
VTFIWLTGSRGPSYRWEVPFGIETGLLVASLSHTTDWGLALAWKEFSMNLSSVWKSRKVGKMKKSVHKPKIPWQQLGLTDPDSVDNVSSIEAIRQEVSSLARYGLGLETRLRSTPQAGKSSAKKLKSAASKNHRSGTAEEG